jgi:hypothetical protein
MSNPFADVQMPPLGDHLALFAGQIMGWVLKGVSEGSIISEKANIYGPYDDALGMHQPVFDVEIPSHNVRFRITVEQVGNDRGTPVAKSLNEQDLRALAERLAAHD